MSNVDIKKADFLDYSAIALAMAGLLVIALLTGIREGVAWLMR